MNSNHIMLPAISDKTDTSEKFSQAKFNMHELILAMYLQNSEYISKDQTAINTKTISTETKATAKTNYSLFIQLC